MSEIKQKIEEKFSLGPDTSFGIFKKVGKELIALPSDGEVLNGATMISHFYHKAYVLVKPIIVDSDEEEDDCELIKVIADDADNNVLRVVPQNDYVGIEDDNVDILDRNIEYNDFLSEHESVSRAIKNSLMEESQGLSFEEELSLIKAKLTSERIIINVIREDVLTGLSNLFSKTNFSPFNSLNVIFVNEAGVDCGGPNRELWRCALESLRKSTLFEGKDYSKTLTNDMMLCIRNKYFQAGQIIAMSLVHGGPGAHFFSTTLTALLLSGVWNNAIPLTLEDVSCYKDYLELKKVIETVTPSELEEAVLNSTFLTLKCNLGSTPIDIEEKEALLNAAFRRSAFYFKTESLVQFFDGLNTCGVGSLLKKFPEKAYEFLTYKGKDISAQELNDMVVIEWSPIGSNRRRLEERAILNWRDYLVDCEDKNSPLKLGTILKFITGCEQVPPLGFPKPVGLQFIHDQDKAYPEFNVCALCICLPVKEMTYTEFKLLMNTVFVFENDHFGHV